MSAHAYIDASALPQPLVVACARRVDSESRDRLISFVGCPITGRELDDGRIEFQWPREVSVRDALINWFEYWGVGFCVLP